jgi:tetratricopeptide (TPR) repeat protein
MEALVSGRAGMALVLDGNRVAALHADRPAELLDCPGWQVRRLLGETKDFQLLKGADLAGIGRELALATEQAEALHVTLILLDETLTIDTRQTAAEDLEELFARPEVRDNVERVLCAHAFPEGADLLGALACCTDGTPACRAFLQTLEGLQGSIEEVRTAWDQVPAPMFGSEDDRTVAQAACVRQGIFRSLARGRADGQSADALRLTILMDAGFRKIKNHRAILQEWTSGLAAAVAPRVRRELEREESEESEARASDRRAGFDRKAAFERMERQKEAIREAMQAGDLPRVRSYVEDLVEDQLASGGAVFACKSLCDLASRAKELGILGLQLELTERSVQLKEDDGWSWSQYGDALLRAGRPAEALDAYDKAVYFSLPSEKVVARAGRAEVLKDLGRLHEALHAYEQTVNDFPQNAFARTGRAEVLRELGRLEDALQAYELTAKDFPQDAVARNGRAEVLRDLGRLEDAHQAYEQAVKDFPQEVFARTGRAEVLRELGRLEEALQAYEQTANDFPQNAVARNGRAEVLRDLGRLEEALQAYGQAANDFPQNAVARTGRAEVLRDLGRLEDALQAYEQTAKDFPQDAVARNGRAEVLRELGRLEDALQAYELTAKDFPQNAFARTGRAEVLRDLGRLEEALQAYELTANHFPQNVVARTGRAEVLRDLGRLEEALQAYDQTANDFPQDAFARTGRAVVLRDLGRLEDALQAYELAINDFPHDEVARNGRATVLVALGHWDEALSRLPDRPPVTEGEWIAYHIRGMILLRTGKLDSAIQIFEDGAARNPRPKDRDYFRTALALARLRQKHPAEAVEVLEETSAPEMASPADLLRLHSFGLLSRLDRAADAYDRLGEAAERRSDVREVREELHRRYLAHLPPQHSDDWLIEQETAILLAAMALYSSLPGRRQTRF